MIICAILRFVICWNSCPCPNHCWKPFLLWQYVCIFALVICHANRIYSMPFYIVVCGLFSSAIFSTLSHKRHDFRKTFIEHTMCSDFLYNFVWNISHSKKNSPRYYRKFTEEFMWIAHYSCILIKLEIPRHSWEISSNIKFHENPFK